MLNPEGETGPVGPAVSLEETPGRLAGRSAIITGAASGQGRAGALLFAREGANLALADLDWEGLRETQALVLGQTAVGVSVHRCDMGDTGQIGALVDDAVAALGGIDVIYSNAGVMSRSMIENLSEEEWDSVNAVNAKGPAFLVQHALPALRASSCASVINVASISGMVTSRAGSTAYSASKGAVIALSRAQAFELAHDGIRVNCIVPGAIDTPMPAGAFTALSPEERPAAKKAAMARNMIKRFGEAEEVASVAVFLASDDASYMTGATIPVDGGWTAT